MNTTDINAQCLCDGQAAPMRAASRAGSRPPAAACEYALQEFFRHPEDIKAGQASQARLEGKRIIVQGLGNVGYHAAKFLSEEDGAQDYRHHRNTTAVSTSKTTVSTSWRPCAALDPSSSGGVKGYPERRPMSRMERQAASGAGMRHSDPGGDGGRDQPRATRRPDKGPAHHRGGERPNNGPEPTRFCVRRAP